MSTKLALAADLDKVLRSRAVSTTDYGALVDGVTDDTAAVRAALAAAMAESRPLHLPAGSSRLVGDGTEILLLTKSIPIFGDGMKKSTLLIDSTVPNTRDVLRIAPPAGGADDDLRGYSFREFGIVAQSGAPARHGIHVDCSVAGRRFSESVFERLWLGHLNDAGRSLYWNNISGGALVNIDGIYTSQVEKCLMFDGFKGDFIGDTNTFENTSFFGVFSPNLSFEASMVPGATTLNIIACNSATLKGWKFHSGTQINLQGCIVEAPAGATGSGGALVDFAGDQAMIVKPTMKACIVTISGGSAINCVHLGSCSAPDFDGNTFVVIAGNYGVDATVLGTNPLSSGSNRVTSPLGAPGVLFSPGSSANGSSEAAIRYVSDMGQALAAGVLPIQFIRATNISSGQFVEEVAQLGSSGNIAVPDNKGLIEVAADGGPVNMILPATGTAGAQPGRILRFVKIDATANTVTIQSSSGTVVATLTALGKAATIERGVTAKWWLISNT